MIVNVNPYDTGHDENSHVMKFAALARDVSTNPAPTVPRATPALRVTQPVSSHNEFIPHRRKVTISTSGPGKRVSEAHLEVLEGKKTCSSHRSLN